MERTPLKNLGLTFLHWLLFLAAAGLGAEVQLAFSQESGYITTGSFLPETVYEIHPVLYPVGTALMIAALALAWIFLFRGDLKHSMAHSIWWQIAWWVLWLVGCFAAFMGYLFVLILAIGLFSTIEPDICIMWILVYPIAMLLIAVAARIVYHFQKKNA